MKTFKTAALLAAAALLPMGAAAGLFVTNMLPVADTMIRSNQPDGAADKNFGASSQITMRTAPAGWTPQYLYALMQFDLMPLVMTHGYTSDEIQEVSLSLRVNFNVYSEGDPPLVFRLYRVNKEWFEGSGADEQAQSGETTWNHRIYDTETWGEPGMQAGVDYQAQHFAELSIATTNLGYYTFDLGSGGIETAQYWMDNPNENYGFVGIAEAQAGKAVQFNFGTREAHSSQHPYLTVVIPEPVSSAFLLLGGGLLFWVRRRRKRNGLLLVCLSAAMLLPLAAGAQTISSNLLFTADTHLRPTTGTDGAEDSNYGAVVGLVARWLPGTPLHLRPLMKFDLQPFVNDGYTTNDLQDISLNLRIGFTVGITEESPIVFNLHRVLKPWEEGLGTTTHTEANDGEVTWNSQAHGETLWGAPGMQAGVDYEATAFYSISHSSTNHGYYTFDFGAEGLAVAQDWMANPSQNYGFVMLAESSGTQMNFGSREDTSFYPYMSATLIPEPVSSAFLLLGGGLLFWVRRRG